MVNHHGALRRNVLWLLSTLTVVVLLFGYHTSTEGKQGTSVAIVGAPVAQPSAAPSSDAAGEPSDQPTAEPSSQPSNQSGSQPSSEATQNATTRTLTGEEAQTQWGPVQVRLTMSGSTIKSVDVIEYPDGNGRDYEINAYALPRLVQETLQAQSAQIDMISGATVTSDGYVRSLQSALDKA